MIFGDEKFEVSAFGNERESGLQSVLLGWIWTKLSLNVRQLPVQVRPKSQLKAPAGQLCESFLWLTF